VAKQQTLDERVNQMSKYQQGIYSASNSSSKAVDIPLYPKKPPMAQPSNLINIMCKNGSYGEVTPTKVKSGNTSMVSN